jgi:hypothetical protein
MNPLRCCGATKNGRRCSLTSTSNFLNDRGVSVAEPLRAALGTGAVKKIDE